MNVKKAILVLIAILAVILYPPSIVPLLIFLILYLYFKKLRKMKQKINKYNINELILSFFMKKYNKIVLDNKINIYKLNDYILLINKNIKWSILVLIQLDLENNRIDLFNNNILSLDNLIFFKINSHKFIYIIIKEDFIVFKLTQNILKNKLNIILSKIDYIYNYFNNIGIRVKLVKSGEGELILI
jgi:hypothetical protein